MRESLLQDYVIPICSVEMSAGAAQLRRLLGTAFFINGEGVFLTARHVLQGIPQAQFHELVYGLCIKIGGYAGSQRVRDSARLGKCPGAVRYRPR